MTSYEDYQPALERMAQTGEQGLLTKEKVGFFARTSGTTGVTKRIPVVASSYLPYLRCEAIFVYLGMRVIERSNMRRGWGLNTVETAASRTPGGIREGFISAYAADGAKVLLSNISCMPREAFGYGDEADMMYIKTRYALQNPDLVFMLSVFMSTLSDLMRYIQDNHALLIRDIETGTIDPSIALPEKLRRALEQKLKPDPERAEFLRSVFSDFNGERLASRLWPKLRVIIAIGTGEFAPFTEKMRSYCDEQVQFCFEMYAASEALMASAIAMEDERYLLIPDSCFFEFLPEEGEVERPLLLRDLKEGARYEVILTTRSGLYRYRIQDVIRVVGFLGRAPLVQFAYRKNQLINITGVKLTAEHLHDAIQRFSQELGTAVTDYSVYPDLTWEPWRLAVYLELEEDSGGEELGAGFDRALAWVNEEYGRMLQVGEVGSCQIHVVPSGTYARYRAQKSKDGANVNQVKTARILDSPEQLSLLLCAVVSQEEATI